MTRSAPLWRRAGLLPAGLALALLPGTALAHATGPATADSIPPAAARTRTAQATATVTLVTGDRVTLTALPGGKQTVTVDRAPGATGTVRTEEVNGHVRVVPAEAEPYLAQGKLDPRLFDVTELVAQGLAGKGGKAPAPLPLIVTGTAAKARSRTAPTTPAGTSRVRALPSIGATAVTARKPAAFWESLTGHARTSGTTRSFSASTGVGKVWLDARVQADMAESNEQIGTPRAWEAGLTGKGVKVAVLDTGIDPDHPDLKGRVVASKSFIEGQEVADRNGHGTHTASTVGGSGAASDGKEKGVAPDADLAVGKVLSDEGEGSESQIIAGMEWAAKDIDAKVVSMSLGSQEPSDGTDPMAQAVNTLTEETGALFVIAAGNYGSPGSIGSPGAADDALTVGAVDSSDQAAYFTSKGPRHLDNALKPDVSAPGVDILAARSSLVAGEGAYTTMSGTSMATPHVAGVAALLAQEHPDWDAARLKNALMSTSKTLDASAYDLGAGRVSVPDATTSPLTATGSADLGFYSWPYEDNKPVTKTLTYTNDSGSPLTVRLSTSDVPAGTVTLADTELTVPAHGSARTTVTGDGTDAPVGQLSGQVLAKDADGTLLAHTAFGLVKEEERYTLTVHVKDRDGAATPANLALQTLSKGADTVPETVGASGTVELRLKPGSYALSTFLDVRGSHGKDSLGLGYLTAPEITLDRDREITLDGRALREISTKLPRAAETRQLLMEATRTANGSTYSAALQVPLTYDSVFAAPTAKPRSGTFEYRTVWRLGTPPLTGKADGNTLSELTLQPGSGRLDGKLSAKLLDAGNGSAAAYEGKDAKGRAVLVHADKTVAPADLARYAEDAGAAALLVTDDAPGRLMASFGTEDGTDRSFPVATVNAVDGKVLARAAKSGGKLKLTGTPQAPYVYDLSAGHPGAIPDKDLTIAPRAKDLATVDTTYYGAKALTGGEFRYSIADAFPIGVGFLERASFPGKRTDYVSTGKDLRWHETVQAGPELTLEERGGLADYPAGRKTELNWFKPVLHPYLGTGLGWGQTRRGNDLSFNTPGWGDSGPDHTGFGDVWNDDSQTQTTQVQVDGETVTKATSSGAYVWDADPAEHTYKVITDTTLDPKVWGTGVKGHSAWEVRSAETPADAETTLPMINLNYDVDTALDGSVRAGKALPIALTAAYVAGASGTGRLTTGALSVSYDAGKTWQQVDLAKKGDTWKGRLSVPRAAKTVSLRASVRDDKGGSATQVLTDALNVK
ncbi:Serine protease, subtilisin family [Streptomyces sp. TverLS-915]|uniref:S8 family serine peptidase n=1 Tax=Streptomyces sp. TverLS-915 TaxID=1839763 RepID=UPI00081E6006|nr:S8 family serine peptidase [Streptomyces sp. TverLS-915]SCE05716.1 Serine protease, subtilisin family [Streptomyces sp. TverLS-915]